MKVTKLFFLAMINSPLVVSPILSSGSRLWCSTSAIVSRASGERNRKNLFFFAGVGGRICEGAYAKPSNVTLKVIFSLPKSLEYAFL
jgi:hypothetical protein